MARSGAAGPCVSYSFLLGLGMYGTAHNPQFISISDDFPTLSDIFVGVSGVSCTGSAGPSTLNNHPAQWIWRRLLRGCVERPGLSSASKPAASWHKTRSSRWIGFDCVASASTFRFQKKFSRQRPTLVAATIPMLTYKRISVCLTGTSKQLRVL